MHSIHYITATAAYFAYAALAAPVVTTPLVSTRQSSSCPAPGQITSPVTYTLYPGTPDKSGPPTSYIDIQNMTGREEREQVVVFKGIPADAKVCTLAWIQATAEEREFKVEDNGSTKVKPFYEFPKAAAPACGGEDEGGQEGEGEEEIAVSYEAIKPLSSASKELELSPDFTFWPDNAGNTTHTAGFVKCAEMIYLHVRINTVNGLGNVLFKQDEKNGFVMKYQC